MQAGTLSLSYVPRAHLPLCVFYNSFICNLFSLTTSYVYITHLATSLSFPSHLTFLLCFVLWLADFNQEYLCDHRFPTIHWGLASSACGCVTEENNCLAPRLHPVVHQKKYGPMDASSGCDWLVTGPVLWRPGRSNSSCCEMTVVTVMPRRYHFTSLLPLSRSYTLSASLPWWYKFPV